MLSDEKWSRDDEAVRKSVIMEEGSAQLDADKMCLDFFHSYMHLLLSQNLFSVTKLFNITRLLQKVLLSSELAKNITDGEP